MTQVGTSNLTFDANGNTTTDQNGKTLVYDAWNRLVQYKNGGSVLVSYAYDSLGRRITENPGTLRDLYFSSAWQVLEEDVSGSMQDQYVWSPVYVDAMIERDTPSQRLYVQQDANWNVTALIDTSGNVQERYIEDPYGVVTILDPNWNVRGSSSFGWIYLYQGGRYDTNSGLYSFDVRVYSPTLGRWMQLDPIGYAASDNNLYRFVSNQPVIYTDSNGLDKNIQPCPNDGELPDDHVYVSVAQEMAAGVYNKKDAKGGPKCVPLSIEMSKQGTKPQVRRNYGKPNQSDPSKINENPWLGRGGPEMLIGDVFDPTGVGGFISLEWIITFNTNPRQCTWGRNIVSFKSEYMKKGSKVAFIPRGEVRDDTDRQNEYIVGNKVFMYDQPGRGIKSSKMIFEVWAQSEPEARTRKRRPLWGGREEARVTKITHWSYVESSGTYYEIRYPIFVYPY